MKRLLFFPTLIIALIFFSGISFAVEDHPRVALILSFGGLGDEAFNDSAFRGYQSAINDFPISAEYVEPVDIEEFEEHQRFFAGEGYDLIITIGFFQEATLEEVALEYPHAHFGIIDGVVNLPNVTSITFREHEGSFLVGVLAALMTESNKIGFIGGAEILLLKKFEIGFVEGVKYSNTQADVFIN